MIGPARRAAYAALRRIDDAQVDLGAALAEARTRLDDERDRALAADITTGTLRWRRTLDHLIEHLATRPLDQLDPAVLTILRLSAYQLLHLTRVPASAVVDDAVDLVRAAGASRATGFANAILRGLVRTRHRLPLPPRPDGEAPREAVLAYLGITHSHPDWLVARWLDRYGFEAAERWVMFNNTIPAVTLRANRIRMTRETLAADLRQQDVETVPAKWAPDGLVVTAGHPLRREHDGGFVAQDEASQLVTLAVDAQPDERVLDLCASPGGKTTALAAAMHDRGLLVACDVRPKRLRLLRETVAQSRAACIRIVHVPARGPLPFLAGFDRVLVDAPCSGLGTVRRDPDIKWRRQPDELAGLAHTQLTLLDRAADLLAPGGRLVYSTCSSEPEENESVVRTFLANRADFVHVPLQSAYPGPSEALVNGEGHFRTLPFAHELEAFFAAAMVKRTS